MKLETYHSIVKCIDSSSSEPVCFIAEASRKHCCPYNTVLAIFTQQVQKKLRRLSYMHNDIQVQSDHLKQYQSQGNKAEDAVYKLSQQIGLPPVMLAKMFIELTGINKNHSAAHLLRNVHLLEDEVFRHQVQYCLDKDNTFGPNIDLIKKTTGEEYELILKDQLTLMKIPFKDENILRDQGYDKTPDLLLSVPVAIGNHVINWIESKASFGDEYTHKQYLREQYWSYWNRFGSGLVIYWFGFIDQLSKQTLDKGIIIMDHMPREVTTLL